MTMFRMVDLATGVMPDWGGPCVHLSRCNLPSVPCHFSGPILEACYQTSHCYQSNYCDHRNCCAYPANFGNIEPGYTQPGGDGGHAGVAVRRRAGAPARMQAGGDGRHAAITVQRGPGYPHMHPGMMAGMPPSPYGAGPDTRTCSRG